MSEPSTTGALDGDAENDEMMADADTDADDDIDADADADQMRADQMRADASELGDMIYNSRVSIIDAGQQIEELKGEIQVIQHRTTVLETYKETQALAKAETDEELKELKTFVNEIRDTMKSQAEKINTLSEENKIIREDLAKHLASRSCNKLSVNVEFA